jgi:4-hydroxy-tetrahydrodipicolinate synthase
MTIRGVFCAASTPVSSEGSIDTARFVNHARNLIADGCTGVALLGTTGEANSFSIAERRNLLEATLKGGLLPSQLMPGTGLCALPDSVELTRHALSLGVVHVVMLPPYYYKQPSEDGLYESYARIIDAVDDNRLKIILYHIPQMSAVPITHSLIARLLKAYPGTVAGIKDSSGDFDNMQAMLKAFPGFSVLAGADPLMKPLLAAGGHGCITAASNLAGKQLATVYAHHTNAAKTADVEKAQERIVAARNISNMFVQIPAIKALVARRYGDGTWANACPPLIKLTDTQREQLSAAMAVIDGGRA